MNGLSRLLVLVFSVTALLSAASAGAESSERTLLTAKGTVVSVDEKRPSMDVKLETGETEKFLFGAGDPYTFNGKYLALGKFKKGDKVILRYYFSKQNNWNYDAGVEKIGIENRSQKPPARKKG